MKKEFDGISRSFFLYEHVLKAECSPFANKMALKMNFPPFCLQMCIFCCTFAAQNKINYHHATYLPLSLGC